MKLTGNPQEFSNLKHIFSTENKPQFSESDLVEIRWNLCQKLGLKDYHTLDPDKITPETESIQTRIINTSGIDPDKLRQLKGAQESNKKQEAYLEVITIILILRRLCGTTKNKQYFGPEINMDIDYNINELNISLDKLGLKITDVIPQKFFTNTESQLDEAA